MVNTSPFSGLIKDNQAGSVELKQDDSSNGNAIYGIAIGKKINLEKTEQPRAASGAVNAIYGNAIGEKKSWHEGTCEYCKAEFKKNTTWQRFCCTEHQALAYEQRTGKKWYGKKTAGQGG